MSSNKVRYTKKDTYIIYDNRRSIMNYIIICISILAITLTGVAYAFSLNLNTAEELSSVPEPAVSVTAEYSSEI